MHSPSFIYEYRELELEWGFWKLIFCFSALKRILLRTENRAMLPLLIFKKIYQIPIITNRYHINPWTSLFLLMVQHFNKDDRFT